MIPALKNFNGRFKDSISVKIPARTRCHIHKAAGFKLVSSIGNIDHPQLFAQPGLKIMDHQGDVTIKLKNMSDVDIEIPKCITIGFIENI